MKLEQPIVCGVQVFPPNLGCNGHAKQPVYSASALATSSWRARARDQVKSADVSGQDLGSVQLMDAGRAEGGSCGGSMASPHETVPG
jgi:hypothetical protein